VSFDLSSVPSSPPIEPDGGRVSIGVTWVSLITIGEPNDTDTGGADDTVVAAGVATAAVDGAPLPDVPLLDVALVVVDALVVVLVID
jgi:hypothetical protein